MHNSRLYNNHGANDGGAFARSMRQLSDTLSATRCLFIRCVKPNAAMRAGEFDRAYVVGQLRAGLLLPQRVASELHSGESDDASQSQNGSGRTHVL